MSAERYDAYVLCTAPRSGSTLLCKLLAATGVAGHPKSYFHDPSIADWREHVGLPSAFAGSEREALAELFDAVRMAGRGATDLFGLRLHGTASIFSSISWRCCTKAMTPTQRGSKRLSDGRCSSTSRGRTRSRRRFHM